MLFLVEGFTSVLNQCYIVFKEYRLWENAVENVSYFKLFFTTNLTQMSTIWNAVSIWADKTDCHFRFLTRGVTPHAMANMPNALLGKFKNEFVVKCVQKGTVFF